MAAPQSSLGHHRGDSRTHLMLITGFTQFWPKSHWEPRSLTPAKCLVGFESGIFRHVHNTLIHKVTLPRLISILPSVFWWVFCQSWRNGCQIPYLASNVNKYHFEKVLRNTFNISRKCNKVSSVEIFFVILQTCCCCLNSLYASGLFL